MTLFDHTSPMLLDGAMGTIIQQHNLSEEDFRGDIFKNSSVLLKGNNDILNITRPDIIANIHRQYLEAGADIITTNTFSSQRISQADYGLQNYIESLNLEGARIARKEVDEFSKATGRKCYVAGSVGPTTQLLSISSDTSHPELRTTSFDEMVEAYFEQMTALIKGGVDALLVETALDAINAKAAMYAAEKAMQKENRKVALMLSITVTNASGRVLSGQSIESYAIALSHIPLFSIGLNCSIGAAAMHEPLKRLAAIANCKISVHPNAGLPNELGEYEDTPQMMSDILKEFVEEGIADIIGGCCGTTPAHIAAFRVMLNEINTRPSLAGKHKSTLPTDALCISGTEPLVITKGNFLNVGERCNVAGSRKFLRLIKEGNLEEAVLVARKQVEDGAMAIDINMDDGLLDAGECMERFINILSADPVAAKVPLMIDSSDFDVVLRGIKCCQGKPIVNSISLKEGETEFIRKAKELRRLGAAVIIMAFDEQGQGVTYQRKIDICARSYKLLTEQAGIPASDIIFDPNILTVATGIEEHANYALDYVKAASWIHENLPGCRVSGGLSNLSFAFRGNNLLRESIHTIFLQKAVPAGMDIAIMNAAASLSPSNIAPDLAKAINNMLFDKRDRESTEILSDIGLRMLKEKEEQNNISSSSNTKAELSKSPEKAVVDQLVKGDTGNIDQLLDKLLENNSPIDIIAGPLMEGMNLTGKLFGEGKIFLPQVVKTARTMKYAVDYLRPFIKASYSSENPDAKVHYSGTALLATVKGDVHDIGKNIVGMILSCNNFRIVDLGVMVPPEDIIEAVEKEKPDFICLSGLITPSLKEMIFTVKSLEQKGINIPVMVGGAATSELHTALKIAPEYSGAVFHVKDAAGNPIIGAALVNPAQRDSVITELQNRQAYLRTVASQHNPNNSQPKQSHYVNAISPDVPKGLSDLYHIHVGDLIPLLDWVYFFNVWKVKPDSDEGKRIKNEAEAILDVLCQDKEAYVEGLIKFMDACGENDTILIDGEIFNATRRNGVSLADFLKPEGEPVGLFATSIGNNLRTYLNAQKEKDIYVGMIVHTLCNILVDAAAQWLQDQTGWTGIRPAIGYPSLPDQSNIFKLNNLLDLNIINISLTETGAMNPPSSVAGFIFPRGFYL